MPGEIHLRKGTVVGRSATENRMRPKSKMDAGLSPTAGKISYGTRINLTVQRIPKYILVPRDRERCDAEACESRDARPWDSTAQWQKA